MIQDKNKKDNLQEQLLQHKALIMVGLMLFAAVIAVAIHWNSSAKAAATTTDHMDETYTIKHDVDTKVAEAPVTQATSTPTPLHETATQTTVVPSPEMLQAQAAFIEEKAKELRDRLA